MEKPLKSDRKDLQIYTDEKKEKGSLKNPRGKTVSKKKKQFKYAKT